SNISVRKQLLVQSPIINSVGESVNSFSLSVSSVWRQRAAERKLKAKEVKESYLRNKPKYTTVLWDSKLIKLVSGEKEERVAILVSSASSGPKIIGIPSVADLTGISQKNSLIAILDDWQIKQDVVALVFDTTGSDTGIRNCCVSLIEKDMNRPVFWLACRHHITVRFNDFFLGGDVMCKLRKPGALHHARFISDSVYFSTLYTQFYLVHVNLADRLRYSFQRVRKECKKARTIYNKQAKERKYVVCSRVLLDIRVVKDSDSEKFTSKYRGPHRVVNVCSNNSVDNADSSYKTRYCPPLENSLDFENRFRKSVATQTTYFSENEINIEIEDPDDAAHDSFDIDATPFDKKFPAEEIDQRKLSQEDVTKQSHASEEDHLSSVEIGADATSQRHHTPIANDNFTFNTNALENPPKESNGDFLTKESE
ncbi:Cc8K15.2-like protein, partial [Daphnia magna]